LSEEVKTTKCENILQTECKESEKSYAKRRSKHDLFGWRLRKAKEELTNKTKIKQPILSVFTVNFGFPYPGRLDSAALSISVFVPNSGC